MIRDFLNKIIFLRLGNILGRLLVLTARGLAMQTLRQDISYALRQMRLSPVFTLTAMLTLALGIGATTAIFSLIHSVMLKSLPVADPSSLYRIGDGNDCCIQGAPQT